MDDTSSLERFTALLPRIDKFARTLSDKDRDLFDRMITGSIQTVMNGFQHYSAEFGDAFDRGQSQLSVGYDYDAAGSSSLTGKYIKRYIKP